MGCTHNRPPEAQGDSRGKALEAILILSAVLKHVPIALALALLPLLASPVSAGVLLTASGLDSAPAATVHGDLHSLVYQTNDCHGLHAVGTVGDMGGEVDQATLSPMAGPAAPLPAQHSTAPVSSGWAQVTLTGGAGCRLILQSGTFAASAARVQPSSEPPAFYTPEASTARPANQVDSHGTLALAVEGAQVGSDLHLQVFGANLTFTNRTGTTTVVTGAASEPYAAGLPAVAVGSNVQREAFLDLWAANLTFTGLHAVLHARDAQVDLVAGEAILREAQLAPSAAPRDARVEAPLRLQAEPVAAALSVTVQAARHLTVGGQTVEVNPGSPWPLPIALPLAAAILLAVGLALRRNDRAIRDLLESHRYEAVLGRAQRTAWVPFLSTRVRQAEAVAQLRLGLVLDASRNLERRRWRRTPLWHYLMAHLEALRLAPSKAEEHLAESISVVPSFQEAAEENPALRELVPGALRRAQRLRQALMDGT